MKRQSLIYQAKNILTAEFQKGFGRSKHIDKINNASNDAIYSRSSYNNALEKCCTFLKFCKESFSLKNLSDIVPEYFTSFVEKMKYKTDVADSYKWAVQKLQHGYNALHSEEKTWVSNEYKQVAEKSQSRARQQMPREIHDRIIDEAYKTKYENGLAFDIARSLRTKGIGNIKPTNARFCIS